MCNIFKLDTYFTCSSIDHNVLLDGRMSGEDSETLEILGSTEVDEKLSDTLVSPVEVVFM